MRTTRKNLRSDCSGVLTMEMALVATFTFFIIPLLMDITTAISSNMTMRSSLRAGTQIALIQPSNTTAIREAVVAASGFDDELVTVNTNTFCECDGIAVSCSTGTCSGNTTPATFMTITASYTPETIITYPEPNPFTVNKTTTIRVR